MNLCSLAYVSTAHADFGPDELAELLVHSRQRNAEQGITGLLLYKGGNFLQVLEGDEDAVLKLKTRIARDPRHHGLVVLTFKPIEARAFGDWSMAFCRLDGKTATDLPGYNRFLATELSEPGLGGQLAPLLESFRRTMR